MHWKNNPARDDRSREDSNSCKTQRASEEVMRKHQILAFPNCQKRKCPKTPSFVFSRVAKGEESGQPAAADMRELVWDDELEAIAQR